MPDIKNIHWDYIDIDFEHLLVIDLEELTIWVREELRIFPNIKPKEMGKIPLVETLIGKIREEKNNGS